MIIFWRRILSLLFEYFFAFDLCFLYKNSLFGPPQPQTQKEEKEPLILFMVEKLGRHDRLFVYNT